MIKKISGISNIPPPFKGLNFNNILTLNNFHDVKNRFNHGIQIRMIEKYSHTK